MKNAYTMTEREKRAFCLTLEACDKARFDALNEIAMLLNICPGKFRTYELEDRILHELRMDVRRMADLVHILSAHDATAEYINRAQWLKDIDAIMTVIPVYMDNPENKDARNTVIQMLNRNRPESLHIPA